MEKCLDASEVTAKGSIKTDPGKYEIDIKGNGLVYDSPVLTKCFGNIEQIYSIGNIVYFSPVTKLDKIMLPISFITIGAICSYAFYIMKFSSSVGPRKKNEPSDKSELKMSIQSSEHCQE